MTRWKERPEGWTDHDEGLDAVHHRHAEHLGRHGEGHAGHRMRAVEQQVERAAELPRAGGPGDEGLPGAEDEAAGCGSGCGRVALWLVLDVARGEGLLHGIAAGSDGHPPHHERHRGERSNA